MKKIIATTTALVLTLSGAAAFAEQSTAYTFAISNPVVTYEGQSIDLSGVRLDLNAMVTDSDIQGIAAQLYTGASNKLAAQATLEYAAGKVMGYLDGMSNAYGINLSDFGVDASMVTGVMSALSLRSALLSAGEMTAQTAAFSLDGATRMAAYSDMLTSMGVGAGDTYTLTISEEMGAELVNTVIETIGSIDNIPADFVSEAKELDIALTLSADMGMNGDAFTINGNGELIARAITDASSHVPYTLSYSDNGTDMAGAFNLQDQLVLSFTENSTAAGSAFQMVMKAADEVITIEFTETPKGAETDYAFKLYDAANTIELGVAVNDNPNGEGFTVALGVKNASTDANLSLNYAGNIINDAAFTLAREGVLTLSANADGVAAQVACNIGLYQYDVDTSAWDISGKPVASIDNIDDTAMSEAMGIAMNVLSALQSDVPMLAALLG